MNNHTKGNLTVGSRGIGTIYNADGNLVAHTGSSDSIDLDTHQANAARIVQCWNSHDSLVAELKRLQDVVAAQEASLIEEVLKAAGE
jgi:hypothetical protein